MHPFHQQWLPLFKLLKMCEAFSKLDNEVILITTDESKSKTNYSKFYDIKSKIYLKK